MRKLQPKEKPLIAWLLSSAGRSDAIDELMVSEMSDGGMGSLRFYSQTPERELGGTSAEATFDDIDGVLVLASLNIDTLGNLYEIDMWRTDFNPIKRWPDTHQISPPPNPSLQRSAFGAR